MRNAFYARTTPAQEVVPIPAVESPAERLEGIAQKIESVQSAADFVVAKLLVEAQELFRYQRNERGFTGWVKTRLNISQSEAYRLLRTHKRFGGSESFPNWETLAPALPRSALLGDPLTPDEVCREVGARVTAGEKLSFATVAGLIIEHRKAKATDSAGEAAGGNGAADDDEEDQSVVERRTQHAALFDEGKSAAGSDNDDAVDGDPDDDADPDYSADHHHDDDGADPDESGICCASTLLRANAALDNKGLELLIQGEPVERILKSMSEEQRAELFDRIVSNQILQASPVIATATSKKLLTNLTGTLHWALSQADPVNGAQGLTIIAGKLKSNKRDPRDIVLTWAKPRAKRGGAK